MSEVACEARIADLKRQVEAERSARINAVGNGADMRSVEKAMDAAEAHAARRAALRAQKVLERAERNRKISLNRLRRAKDAEATILRQADEIETLRRQVEEAGKNWEFAVETLRRRREAADTRIARLEALLSRDEAGYGDQVR
jgi:glycerophosphoryl diester phosphodiesterase